MTTKTECTYCGRWINLDDIKYAYDKDEPYCQDCLDRLEAREDNYAEGVFHDRDVDAMEVR